MGPEHSDQSFQPKLVYLAKRNPALSHRAFVQRWRQHGALGRSLPRWRNIARYVHYDALHPGGATPGLATGYDGIGLIWHRSPAARAAHLADRHSREQMERDELETFAAPVASFCLLARETVLLPPARTVQAAVKLTRFLRAPAHAFAATCAAAAAGLRAQLQAHAAAVLGHVIDVPLPPERGERWGLESDCIEELWFADVAAALRAARLLAAGAHSDAARAITVLTNEVLLYEG